MKVITFFLFYFRIITLLSPAFLDSPQCLDEYNMAMCCNKLLNKEILVPFYIQPIISLPSYMGLVQWIDCRLEFIVNIKFAEWINIQNSKTELFIIVTLHPVNKSADCKDIDVF